MMPTAAATVRAGLHRATLGIALVADIRSQWLASFMSIPRNIPGARLSLEYPMSLGVYDGYPQAQHVVDYLADHDFPVQDVEIVGTELRSIERVTGRLTRGKVALAGAVSGLWIGLFVGVAFALFSKQGQLGFLITTPVLGAVFMLVWSQLGFTAATRGGTRDFASISQIVATKYEVLVAHNLIGQARELVAAMPPI
jgi:hypothetical protein